MWIYEKKLEFPVKITQPDARLAQIMIEQYGGGDGEIGAALRYLSQKFTMVSPQAQATLNDIATEELAHVEMMGTIVHQLTQGLTKEQLLQSGLDTYYVNHGFGIFPCGASGVPFNAAAMQSKGDPITDLYEDMAAEQKARSTYEYLIDLTDDPAVLAPLRFLREREIVHFQRFGEANHTDLSRFYRKRNRCIGGFLDCREIYIYHILRRRKGLENKEFSKWNPQVGLCSTEENRVFQGILC